MRRVELATTTICMVLCLAIAICNTQLAFPKAFSGSGFDSGFGFVLGVEQSGQTEQTSFQVSGDGHVDLIQPNVDGDGGDNADADTDTGYAADSDTDTGYAADSDTDTDTNTNNNYNNNDASESLLTIDTMNSKILDMEYAVRGEVLMKALELEKHIKEKKSNGEDPGLPFDKIVKCNIGNPQALGQKPISFIRQVLALVLNPDLMTMSLPSKGKNKGSSSQWFPKDVIQRAQAYLEEIRSVGAYTESQGIDLVREEVADFITRRDGFPEEKKVSPNDIFLTEGASQGAETMMTAIIRSRDDAILVPIPQYPLYSALSRLLDAHFAGYELKEHGGWDTTLESLKQAVSETRKLGKIPRALVVINPGNPTGSTLREETMRKIVDFAAREGLMILADEVYQDNVYLSPNLPFVSFRKVVTNMMENSASSNLKQLYSKVQLVSLHSISKGITGECGLRGGYMDLIGFSKEVRAMIYKLVSVKLCSNVPGQIAVGLMVNPPREGDPSYPTYKVERGKIFTSLKRRASKVQLALNKLPGVHCDLVRGAMYAFPSIELPLAFLFEAQDAGKSPDTLYALRLLEATGVVVVPGNGFGQRHGTWHFRTTFLPPENELDDALARITKFHKEFMEKYNASPF